jgi:hypothetical protein
MHFTCLAVRVAFVLAATMCFLLFHNFAVVSPTCPILFCFEDASLFKAPGQSHVCLFLRTDQLALRLYLEIFYFFLRGCTLRC